MTEFVLRRTDRTYRVGEPLDRDGGAVVNAVEPASSNLALKQYLPDTLQQRSDLEARIQAMIDSPPAYRAGRSDLPSCAWPEDAAYVSGRFVGFVMPRVDTAGAVAVHDVATSRAGTWRHRVAVAESLARAVALLHDADVVLGDLPERNLLSWGDGWVTLLGCDRMQVVDPGSGRRFPCRAEPDGSRAPELMHASMGSTLRTSSSDIFSLAVRIHMLLLHGGHPFQGQWRGRGHRPAQHVLAGDGLWSYAGNPKLAPLPDAVPLEVLPQALRQYFRAAFVDGARRPQDRPPAHQWVAALMALRESLVTCAREPDHVHGDHLPECPWCPPEALPTRPVRPVRPGYTRPHLPARRPATAAASSPGPAPTRPADDTDSGTGPAPLTVRLAPTPSTGRRPTPPRRRSALRVAAWVALAVVGIGAVGVAGATSRSGPAVTGPAGAASTRAASAPPSAGEPQDPTAALERMRAEDAATVEALAESWVAQLSARPAGAGTAGGTAADAAVLAGHDALRKRYPAAVLLRSTDWNYGGDFWITVIGERFATAEEANAWCDTHRIAPRECFAKELSHSGAVEGSERYRG
ncbi:hypothetical protein [Pseudonocardia humida]|uniref:Protein kinase domain-containing protein n=1 Tax=Pseudonocardia humida TaxID=2800819 RepID=A0ABT1A7I0_9PSEU|nr:hypothetical protein [Pseudonocardia humida]MCO1658982.1 hypothetical protein [Pseudonocardia humida]